MKEVKQYDLEQVIALRRLVRAKTGVNVPQRLTYHGRLNPVTGQLEGAYQYPQPDSTDAEIEKFAAERGLQKPLPSPTELVEQGRVGDGYMLQALRNRQYQLRKAADERMAELYVEAATTGKGEMIDNGAYKKGH